MRSIAQQLGRHQEVNRMVTALEKTEGVVVVDKYNRVVMVNAAVRNLPLFECHAAAPSDWRQQRHS